MRAIFVLLLMIAVAVGAAWLLVEPWIAGQARMAVERSAASRAASVDPLRRPDRFGIRVNQLEYRTAIGGLPTTIELPRADFWLAPYQPTALRIDPFDRAVVARPGARHDLTLDGTAGDVSVSPLRGMAITGARLRSDAVEMGGRSLLRGLVLRLDATSDDRLTGAAFDLDLRLDALEVDRLAVIVLRPLALPGTLAISGQARLWLDRAPNARDLFGDGSAPRVVGWRSDQGVTLRLGDLGIRVVGQLTEDAQGRPSGILALYSRDLSRIIDAAVSSGIASAEASLMVGALLGNLGRAPIPANDAQIAFPDPAEGELRLPVVMKNGRLSVGGIPLGVVPRLRDLVR